MASRDYICERCGNTRTLPASVVARYPNWVPKHCTECRDSGARSQASGRRETSRADALETAAKGPQTGVFTDGFCEPNPGRGGWGAVKVVNGEILVERHGREADTTNNRMELKALIEGYRMLGADEELSVFTDSELCVNIVTKWAEGWKANGWTRGKKREEIKNLDLVKELYALSLERPRASLQWIKGHAGYRWNEYADALSKASLEGSSR